VSVESVARFADSVLSDFVQAGRPKSYLLFSEFFENYINDFSNSTLEHGNELRALNGILRIFSAAAFIRWKHVRDFDLDAIRIAENMILPIDRAYNSTPLRDQLQGRPPQRGRIVYLTNFHPFAFNGVATCFSVFNLMSSFVDYQKIATGLSMSVWVINERIDRPTVLRRHVSGSGKEMAVVEFQSGQAVFDSLRRDPPEYIFIDYFTYPFNLVPILFPNAKIVYFGFGFSLFVFSNVKAIVTQELTPRIDKFLLSQARGLVGRYVCPPRIHAETPNLELRLPDESDEKLRLQELRGSCERVYASLCRAGKVSPEFVSLLDRLLARDPSGGVVIAGAGCQGLLSELKRRYPRRVLALGNLPSGEVLRIADVYLETFPEHQGLAVVEAMKSRKPVVFLDNADCPHTLLNERAGSGRAASLDDYLECALRLGLEPAFRGALVDSQERVLASREISPSEYWGCVFAAAG
jgi:hypothetical protein